MVLNIFKEKQVEGNSLADVNKSDWFYNAVSMPQGGLIAGYEDSIQTIGKYAKHRMQQNLYQDFEVNF